MRLMGRRGEAKSSGRGRRGETGARAGVESAKATSATEFQGNSYGTWRCQGANNAVAEKPVGAPLLAEAGEQVLLVGGRLAGSLNEW
jgi:hypothetical protein